MAEKMRKAAIAAINRLVRGGGALLFLLLAAGGAQAKTSVIDTPHNLSANGGRGTSSGLPGVTFSGEQRVCVFCHVPHNADAGTPLWSRTLPADATDYKPYQSSTLNASPKPDKPTGASRLCLSCHDGTIALGQFVGSKLTDATKMPTGATPAINHNLTTDLSDDHPISFAYTDVLAQKSQLVSPSTLPPSIKLQYGTNLECTACHDPHDNQYGNFLVMNNTDPGKANYQPGSPLCTSCHNPNGWTVTSHNPVHSNTLVNGCMNCHSVHTAPGAVRLLKQAKQEDNCLASCHNGSDTASVNLKPLFAPTMYRHPVDDPKGEGVHDENETLPAQTYHVQCVDCHNPHQANSSNAPLSAPPLIDGRLQGVRKDSLGTLATMEYEVCFKCHSGDNASKFAGVNETPSNRMIADPNEANRFDPLNPSFHPVMANRRSSGASLLMQYQSTMTRIYCVDCHNNSQGSKAGGAGPNGPHGSQYPHILIAEYDMPAFGAGRSSYNTSQYALCYRCHSEDYVMTTGSAFNNGGNNEHAAHVKNRLIPCFVCHDPHGVSYKMGATPTNNAHLINFDRSYASGPLVPNPVYTVNTDGSRSCTVNCHTVSGNTETYASGVANTLRMLKRRAQVLPH